MLASSRSIGPAHRGYLRKMLAQRTGDIGCHGVQGTPFYGHGVQGTPFHSVDMVYRGHHSILPLWCWPNAQGTPDHSSSGSQYDHLYSDVDSLRVTSVFL